MNVKKKLPPFLAGALTAALVIGLAGTALAAVSGTVRFDGASVSIWGGKKDVRFSPGDTFTTENGTQAPSVITYVDEQGGGTTYLSLRRLAELLDAPIGWDGEAQTVLFAQSPPADGDVHLDVGITEPQADPSVLAEPQLGITAGPFTEIASLADKGDCAQAWLMGPAEFKANTDLENQRYNIFEPYGRYVEITVTNHGEPVTVDVCRPYYTSMNESEDFSTVLVNTGETLTRAFLLEEGAQWPTNFLRLDVRKLNYDLHETMDITWSVIQYRLDESVGYPEAESSTIVS